MCVRTRVCKGEYDFILLYWENSIFTINMTQSKIFQAVCNPLVIFLFPIYIFVMMQYFNKNARVLLLKCTDLFEFIIIITVPSVLHCTPAVFWVFFQMSIFMYFFFTFQCLFKLIYLWFFFLFCFIQCKIIHKEFFEGG